MTRNERVENKIKQLKESQRETLKFLFATVFLGITVFCALLTDSIELSAISFVAYLIALREFNKSHDSSRICLKEFELLIGKGRKENK